MPKRIRGPRNFPQRTFSLDDGTILVLRNESARLGTSVSGLLRLIAGKIGRGELRL